MNIPSLPKGYSPSLLDVPISFFEHPFANAPSQTTTLRRIVKTAYYRSRIEAIRIEPDMIVQNELKNQLPAITPVALLHHRKTETSFAEKISQQWPLMMGDIDQKDNPQVDMVELKRHISRLPYVLLCAHSVRGGLWFTVRLPDHQTPESLAAHFRYLQKLFVTKFGILLDSTKGGNPTSLRFVSYDEVPYLNDDAGVLTGTYTPPAPKPQRIDYSRSIRLNKEELPHKLIRCIQAAGEGQRHEKLLRAARLAGGYIAAGQLDEQTAIYALETAASDWPNFTKSQKTIRDGIRYGLSEPIYKESYQESEKCLLTAKPPIYPLAVGSIQTKSIFERPLGITKSIAEQAGHPGSLLKPDESQIEQLTIDLIDSYPVGWDEPYPPGAKPKISAHSFHEWQCRNVHFGQMGLASLKTT